MTVVLVGIYGDGKGVIMLSDKMMTLRHPAYEPIRVERDDVIKIVQMNSTIAVLFASDRADWAFKLLKEVSFNENTELDKFVEDLRTAFAKQRYNLAFIRELTPLGFSDYDDYHKRVVKYPKERVKGLDQKLVDYEHPLDIIVVGKGADEYKIVVIGDPGETLEPVMGFYASGAGANEAMSVLAKKYQKSMSKKRARMILDEAKTAAESILGVGKKTESLTLSNV